MVLFIPAPIRTTAPMSNCVTCGGFPNQPCPLPATISTGCGGCPQPVLLAIRYLGSLRCWTPADGSCNPAQCCPQMIFDPWTGLRAGLWTSSIAVPISIDCPEGRRYAVPLTVTIKPPALRRVLLSGSGAACGTTEVATVTVFDDGTYALA